MFTIIIVLVVVTYKQDRSFVNFSRNVYRKGGIRQTENSNEEQSGDLERQITNQVSKTMGS